MAKAAPVKTTIKRVKKTTSIGNSPRSRYNTKNQKKMGVKRYRGQGK